MDGWLRTTAGLLFILGCTIGQDICPEPEYQLPSRVILSNAAEERDAPAVEGTELTYVCEPGYVPYQGSTWKARCTRDDGSGRLEWDMPQDIACRAVSCGHPGSVVHGRPLSALFTFPNFVEYACDTGYELEGSPRMYCQSNGRWDGPPPQCKVVRCGAPETVEQGAIDFKDDKYQSVATYRCGYGYRLVGDSQRVCAAEGHWTGSPPTCEEWQCPPPGVPDNGGWASPPDPVSRPLGYEVRYFCPVGTVLDGPNTTRCLENGIWSSDPPHCRRPCTVPKQDGGYIEVETTAISWGFSIRKFEEVKAGSIVADREQVYHLRCLSGYETDGGDSLQLRCLDGGWTPLSNPVCTPKSCKELPYVSNGRPERIAVQHSESIRYTCDRDYEMHGGSDLRCILGEVKGTVPTCRKGYCDHTGFTLRTDGMMPVGRHENGQRLKYSCISGYESTNAVAQCLGGLWVVQGDSGRFCRSAPITPPAGFFPDVSSHNAVHRTAHKGCAYDERQDRFKAYNGNRRVLPHTTVPHGTTLKYHCEPVGTLLLDGANETTCNDGLWNINPPFCVDLPGTVPRVDVTGIPGPGGIVHADPGTTIPVVCHHGEGGRMHTLRYGNVQVSHRRGGETVLSFTLTPDEEETISCIPHEGTRNIVRLKGKLSCRQFPRVDNGRPRQDSVPHNESVLYSCDQGYDKIGGDDLQCLWGNVEGTPPVCQRSFCDNTGLPLPADGVAPVAPHRNGEILRYTCEYTHESTNAEVRCENGSWILLSGGDELCRTKSAKRPCIIGERQDRFKAYDGNNPVRPNIPVPHGTTIRYHCEPVGTLLLKGSTRTKCNDGRWDRDPPYCVKLPRTKPAVHIQATEAVGPGGIVYTEPNTTVRTACHHGLGGWMRTARAGDIPKQFYNVQSTHSFTLGVNEEDAVYCISRGETFNHVRFKGRHLHRCAQPEYPVVLHRNNVQSAKVSCAPPYENAGPTYVYCMPFSEWNVAPTCVMPAQRHRHQLPPTPMIGMRTSSIHIPAPIATSLGTPTATIRHGATEPTASVYGSSYGQETRRTDASSFAITVLDSSDTHSRSSLLPTVSSVERDPHRTVAPTGQPTDSAVQHSEERSNTGLLVQAVVTTVGATIPSRPCRSSDLGELAIAFLGLQRLSNWSSVANGVAATVHCEPIGLTAGDTMNVTCRDGLWVANNPEVSVSKPLCLPAGTNHLVVSVHGEYVVGPGGVLYANPGQTVNMTCEYTGQQAEADVTWEIRDHVTGNGTPHVLLINRSRASVSVRAADELTCVCRTRNITKAIRIKGAAFKFCTEPVLSTGLKVTGRHGGKVTLSCDNGLRMRGPKEIVCSEAGEWSHQPPACLQGDEAETEGPQEHNKAQTPQGAPAPGGEEPQVDTTLSYALTTEIARRESVTCAPHEFFEAVEEGVVIEIEQEAVPHGTVFEAHCEEAGYIPVGDSGKVVCQADGTWTFARNLRCIKGCHNFAAKDESLIVEGHRDKYHIGDMITLTCPNGTDLQPHVERIVCLGDRWSESSLPKCAPKQPEPKKRARVAQLVTF